MMNLWQSKKEGVVSLAVLLAVLLALFLMFLSFVAFHAERYRSELRKDARILQELHAIEAVQDKINQVQQSYQERELQNWFYASRNVDDVSLDVQRRVSDWLIETQVQRVTPVVTRTDGEHVAVGVQVQFVATMEALMRLARNIDEAKPILMIEKVRLSPASRRRNDPEAKQEVSVQMTVQTYLPSAGESK